MTVVLITARSSLAVKLRGDRVWEWKWLSQQNIGPLFISAFISLLAVPTGQTAATERRNLSEIALVKMTKPSQSNSAQLWAFNLAILSMMMRPSAATVTSKLNFPSQLQFGRLSSERSGVQCMKRLSMKLHKRAGSLTIAFYCRLQPKNEKKVHRNTKHLQICTRHDCGCLHSNITMWWLAGVLLGLPHAIQTVARLYSASGWSCLNYYIVTIFLHVVSQD